MGGWKKKTVENGSWCKITHDFIHSFNVYENKKNISVEINEMIETDVSFCLSAEIKKEAKKVPWKETYNTNAYPFLSLHTHNDAA